jgi:hypothetical protein
MKKLRVRDAWTPVQRDANMTKDDVLDYYKLGTDMERVLDDLKLSCGADEDCRGCIKIQNCRHKEALGFIRACLFDNPLLKLEVDRLRKDLRETLERYQHPIMVSLARESGVTRKQAEDAGKIISDLLKDDLLPNRVNKAVAVILEIFGLKIDEK